MQNSHFNILANNCKKNSLFVWGKKGKFQKLMQIIITINYLYVNIKL